MKTKAAVAVGAGKPLEIHEVDLAGPGPNEVLVEIKATGICHTDAYTLSGKDSEGLPFEPGQMPSLGSHVLIELFGCDKQSLEQETSVGTAMRNAAVESKATVVAESFHEFKPWGVAGAVIIQESHYTIHTWPEHGYAAVDLFYCGGTVHVDRAVDVLRERFKPSKIKFLVVRRGIQSEVEG